MKERPMLFSGPMVRAILEGRKTQTRRVIKHGKCLAGYVRTLNLRCMLDDIAEFRNAADEAVFIRCPYGQPGDRLWVRETFGTNPDDGGAVYRATDPDWETCEGWTWKPSIHMPRWASRITLEITGIRAERLQTISLDDARAEGVETTDRFAALWTDTYGSESWNADPWLWVIEFAQSRKEAGV